LADPTSPADSWPATRFGTPAIRLVRGADPRGGRQLALDGDPSHVALESRLLETLSEDELASLRREAEAELAEPGRWGTTFTLIQSWGRLEG